MLLALPFLIVLGVVLPVLAWLSLRHAKVAHNEQAALPNVPEMVVQIIVLQTVVAGLAALAVYGIGLKLAWWSTLTPVTVSLALVALSGVLILTYFEAQERGSDIDKSRDTLRRISATDPRWIGATLYAGIIEEVAYRGVLTLLLAGIVGYIPAAIASAVVFGLAHLTSGWRAVPFGIVFALAMQALVYTSAGLVLAMVVHVVYDLIAAWLGHRMVVQR